MVIKEKYTVPAHEYTRVVSRCCDLCGFKTENGDNWEYGSYEINETEVEVTVRHKEGFSCSDGGNGTETRVDICPKCFKEKLVPWLNSQGAKVEVKEWDW